MTRTSRYTISIVLAILAAVVTLLALTVTTSSATSYPLYIPRIITVGPDGTEFIIKDESRGSVVTYYCAFLSPKYVSTNRDGTKLYVPAIQCNR